MNRIAAAVSAFILAVAALAGGAHAGVRAAIEAPGMQYGTARFDYGGVEEFDGLSDHKPSVATDFSGSDIRATMTGFTVAPADEYGGAFGTGAYAVAGSPATTIGFTSGPAVNYFGLWVSAMDAGNDVAFFRDGVKLASFNLVATLGAMADPAAYLGNPAAAYRGRNPGQAYAFIDFFSDTPFDRIDLTQAGGGVFEFDNVTVGFSSAATVPEPATWAMLALGFGLVGAAARRRRAGRVAPAIA